MKQRVVVEKIFSLHAFAIFVQAAKSEDKFNGLYRKSLPGSR
jgi:hypothetical protein